MLSVNVNVKIRSPLFAFEKQMYFQKHHSSGFLNVSSFLNQRYSCELVKLPSVYQQTNWDFHTLKWFTVYLLRQIWLQVYRSVSLKSLMLYYRGSSFIYRRCHCHDRRHFGMMLKQVLFHLHGPVGYLYRIKEQSLAAEPDLWPPCGKTQFRIPQIWSWDRVWSNMLWKRAKSCRIHPSTALLTVFSTSRYSAFLKP